MLSQIHSSEAFRHASSANSVPNPDGAAIDFVYFKK